MDEQEQQQQQQEQEQEQLRLYLRRDVDPFLLRALTEIMLHKPLDVRTALARYVAWRQAQRAAVPYAAGGGLDYEGNARPAWLEGAEFAKEDDVGMYASSWVTPVLMAVVRHLVGAARQQGGRQAAAGGEALEAAVAGFLEAWGKQEKKWEEKKEPKGDVTLLVLGLGGAGKSTLVAALQGEADPQVTPTTGFHPHTAVLTPSEGGKDGGTRLLRLHDVGGGEGIRGIWASYYHDAHAVVWVTACTDLEIWRGAEAPVLRECLAHPYLVGKPLLVFHNRMHDPSTSSSLTTDALREELLQGPQAIAPNHCLRVKECVAKNAPTSADGIDPRIDAAATWLVEAVDQEWDALAARVQRDTAAAAAAAAEARARKDRELLRSLVARAAAVGMEGGKEPGEKEEGVLAEEEALAFLAEATGTTNDGTATDSGGDPQALSLPPLAAALAARLGFHRTGLRLLAGMHRGLGGGWEAVAAAVEEAVLAEDA